MLTPNVVPNAERVCDSTELQQPAGLRSDGLKHQRAAVFLDVCPHPVERRDASEISEDQPAQIENHQIRDSGQGPYEDALGITGRTEIELPR